MSNGTVSAEFNAETAQADELYQAMIASERKSSGK
jgi:hypothetical protein